MMPAIEYFLSRINDPSGDRYKLAQIFRAARLFNPNYVAMISYQEGISLIDNFKYFPLFNEGEDSIVARLKRGWGAYRKNCVRVHSTFNFKKDKSAVLSWNYQAFLRLDDEYAEDHSRRRCRYCGTTSQRCGCNGNLRVWWEAAEVMALVVPS